MKHREIRELVIQWYRAMDRRARRAFVGPDVVQRDFQNVWVGISRDGLRMGHRHGDGEGYAVMLEPGNAPILEDLRRSVVETIREEEDRAVKRELHRGEFAGFASELKRDLAEDAFVGDL